jgi:hypothetical protein
MWSWRQRVVGAVVVVATGLLAARPAHAEEKARLVYVRGSGTAGCPAEIDLRLSVVARLGYDPFSPQASRVVLARIERRRAALVGIVELVNDAGLSSGRRELYAPKRRCDELARSMALSISLTIDPERALAARASGHSGGGVAFSALPAEPPSPEPAPPTPYRTHDLRLFAGVTALAAEGLLPTFALGGGAHLGIGWRSLSLQLEARLMTSFRHDLPSGGSLNGQTADSGLVGCRSFDLIGACVVAQLGIERVRSHELVDLATVTKIHGAAGPRFLLYFPQGTHVSLVVGLEGLLNLSRNRARMHRTDVWRSPLLSAALVVGAETDFL